MSDDLVGRVAREMEDAAVLWLYENPSLRPENVPYELLASTTIALLRTVIRNEALEEAAKVVTEHYQELCTEHRLLLVNRAAAIRALVKEPQ